MAETPDWMLNPDNNCTRVSNKDTWFPEGNTAGIREYAKHLCAGCPSKTPCLAYAVSDLTIVGIWGGTTQGQRKTLANPRKQASPSLRPCNDCGGERQPGKSRCAACWSRYRSEYERAQRKRNADPKPCAECGRTCPTTRSKTCSPECRRIRIRRNEAAKYARRKNAKRDAA